MTTARRPLINTRDEPLCGRDRGGSSGGGAAPGTARLHVIFYDSTLSHVASLLKVGVMQIILAMIEAERISPSLALDDPLDALMRWSHDPTLRATARTISGRRLTALELQLLFLEEAARFARAGGCEGIVPESRLILDLWEDTLAKLQAGDLPTLARRLDWVLKRVVLRRALERRRLSWCSAEAKHLDQIYGSLDPARGLYWAYERAGLVERVVPEERIAWFLENPPADTRAWTRAMLLRRAGPSAIDDVDWDLIRFRSAGRVGPTRYRTLDLPDPLGYSKGATTAVFRRAASLEALLDALGARDGVSSDSAPMESPDGPAAFPGPPRSDGAWVRSAQQTCPPAKMQGFRTSDFVRGGGNGHENS